MSTPESRQFIEALTYDDVLLVPDYSSVLPRDTDPSSKLSRNINLKIPLVSAAMDTVTEADLAISMALEGGIGIIHKNMSLEAQAAQVRIVKRSQSGMILDPITLNPEANVGDANKVMRDYKIGGIPIVDKTNKLIGIITNRDLRFQRDNTKLVSELMTKDKIITAGVGVDLTQAEDILKENKIEKLPIVDKDFKLTGLITYKDILKKIDRPNACKDEYGRLRAGAAVGVTTDIIERIEALLTAGVDVVGIDHVALGSDMDANYKPVLDSYLQLPQWIEGLKAKGLSEDEVQKLAGGNAVRVLTEVFT